MDASDHSAAWKGVVGNGPQHNGNIYGAVTNNHYSALQGQGAGRVETPPNPLSTVPFPRDPDYVHRDELVDQIREKLSVPAARVALVGLGGVGKSQLAIQYSHRVRETSPSTWVLCIYSSSRSRFELSIKHTIERLKVPGRSDSHANVIELFRNWLLDEGNGTWLIILDNADDAAFLLEPAAQIHDSSRDPHAQDRCIDFLPTCCHGSMLVTSRSRIVAREIVEWKNIINVEPMLEQHAVALVQKKLGSQENRQDTERLYVEKVEKNDNSTLSLLDRDEGDLRRDREAVNSIMLTWEISFEHIREISPSAADLLSIMRMSFFDRQAIPEDLLHERDVNQKVVESVRGEWQQEDDTESSGNCSHDGHRTDHLSSSEDESDNAEEAFEEDVTMLRNYSMISTNTDVAAFQMHRLVQLAT